MKTCQHCGKHFSRGYNLQRHKNSSCPMLSRESEEQNMSMEYPEYGYEHEDNIEDGDEEMANESHTDGDISDDDDDDDDDMSDTDSDDSDAEHEESVWGPIIEEAKARHRQDYEELVQGFLDNGVDEEGAKDKAYYHILPSLQREARNIYLEKLKWMREMRKNPIHRQVMETKQSFMDEDEFDGEEALEAAVKKRKFLLNRIFEDDDGYDESGKEDNEEDFY